MVRKRRQFFGPYGRHMLLLRSFESIANIGGRVCVNLPYIDRVNHYLVYALHELPDHL